MAEEVSELIEQYAGATNVAERDGLFERLKEHSEEPLTRDFLAAMIRDEADIYLRLSAARVLAISGDEVALQVLEGALATDVESEVFEFAAAAMGEVCGTGFFEPLLKIWKEKQRPTPQLVAAMLTLETVDSARALNEFSTFISGSSVNDLRDEELMQAALACLRHEHLPATEALLGLAQRIEKARDQIGDCEDLIVSLRDIATAIQRQ